MGMKVEKGKKKKDFEKPGLKFLRTWKEDRFQSVAY